MLVIIISLGVFYWLKPADNKQIIKQALNLVFSRDLEIVKALPVLFVLLASTDNTDLIQ